MVSAIARAGRRPRQAEGWRNWARNQTMRPRVTSSPVDAEQVRAAVLRAREGRGTLKMSGTGHSFTPIALTDGELLLPDRLRGEIRVDLDAMTATAPAGTPLHVLNRALENRGVTLHNMGDIAEQTLAGAVSTGTHGSGGVAAGLAAQVVALTLVSGTGETIRIDARTDPETLSLAVVGLGALGVVTELTFAVEPLLLLRATEQALRWSEAVDRLPELVAAHHHVDLHWFPHTDGVLVKRNDRLDAPLEEAQPLGALRRWWDDELMANGAYGAMVAAGARVPALVPAANAVALRAAGSRTYSDVPHRVLTSPRRFRFREMEYAVPWEAAPAALAAVRRRIAEAPWRIGIPVEIRTAPADAVALSTASGRRSVYLAFHLPARLDPSDYFGGVEPILRAHEGRPHWGKLHTLDAGGLAALYPRFGDFLALRERLDPDRVFANDHLRRVLGD